MKKIFALVIILVGLITPVSTFADEPSAKSEAPAANPQDVETIDAILAATYDVISGAAGEKRDWDRMRSLFHSEGRLIPLGKNGARLMSVEDYIENAEPFFMKEGFYETEIARKVDRYGGIAQVFSTYEARHAPDEAPFIHGINSFQLLYENDRWWVLNIFWQGETEDNPIPEDYLE